MSADVVVPIELQQLAQELADRQAGPMSVWLAELGELLAPPENVRMQPGQRFSPESHNFIDALATATNPEVRRVAGRHETRKRVRIVYLGASAGPDAVRIGMSREAVTALNPNNCFLLNTVNRECVIEANECDVFAASVTATAGFLTWYVEEFKA